MSQAVDLWKMWEERHQAGTEQQLCWFCEVNIPDKAASVETSVTNESRGYGRSKMTVTKHTTTFKVP